MSASSRAAHLQLRLPAEFLSLLMVLMLHAVTTNAGIGDAFAQAPRDAVAQRSSELRIVDRTGLTRFSAQVRGASSLDILVSRGQVDVTLTHVDGLSAPVRGRSLNDTTFRFDRVPPGTWRASVFSAGTEREDSVVRIQSIKDSN